MNTRTLPKWCQRAACAASLLILSTSIATAAAAATTDPIAEPALVFEEKDGIAAVEAEHFFRQEKSDKRAWHRTSSNNTPDVAPDGDPAHVAGASGGAYLEALPDTRRTHDDKLIPGENFAPEPGKLAVLHYKVQIQNPGRYHVWVRSHSTGTEDNGLHVGLDGEWPESGQRWQTVAKNGWYWDSLQRTEAVHTGVPGQLFLDINKSGEHIISFSMREDGFEFDKFILARDRSYQPEGLGPEPRIKSGKAPAAFALVAAPVNDLTEVAPSSAPAKPGTSSAEAQALVEPRKADGKGEIAVEGELKQWHKVTLTLDGPFAHERDNEPNPFTDYRMTVAFTHESGEPSYKVPGYFAADGNAVNTSAESGTRWRAHLSPDKPGRWSYKVSFVKGKHAAVSDTAGEAVLPFDGKSGNFEVAKTDRTGADFRARGRLQYVGKHHLQFAGSKEYFLKAGPDAPETLLAYTDFDNTLTSQPKVPLKTWAPHLKDWREGDPTWKDGKGKGLIGALNYLAGKGVNAFSFLTYNAGGDGDNVWPFVERNEKLHYDCSKLDQWGVVFDHATARGLYLHFKMQENEMDDNRAGHKAEARDVPESLDGGKLGVERKLYCRELIARFGHQLALNWNIGEENTQSTEEIVDMVRFLHTTDPYQHNIVIHTFPEQQDKVYTPLLGDKSLLTGASLQNSWNQVHQRTLKWVAESAKAGRPWVVPNDEQGPANLGVPPDPGYKGHDGVAVAPAAKGKENSQPAKGYTMHDIRKLTLWGNLMAGGAGVEYYFGYQLPENDLLCEDFRSREKTWDYCRVALDFFREQKVPFWEMKSADALVGNTANNNSRYCFAKAGDVYLVYLPSGGTTDLDLTGQEGAFEVRWFNPRSGGDLQTGNVQQIQGGGRAALGVPPVDTTEDWLAVVRAAGNRR